MAVSSATAKSPNLNHRQNFQIYGRYVYMCTYSMKHTYYDQESMHHMYNAYYILFWVCACKTV